MADGIYVALSGAVARGRQVESVANNLANLESTAYRRQQITFSEVLGRLSPEEAAKLSGMPMRSASYPVDLVHVAPAGQKLSDRQGTLLQTGEDLDMALNGPGFFELRTPAGLRYTRDGHFQRTQSGFLVAADGAQVMGRRGPLRIPEGSLMVGPDGQVMTAGQSVGRLRLVDFGAQGEPVREGANRFRATSRPLAAQGRVVQHHLESSNVNALREMVAMIEAHRGFDSLQQAIQSYREIDAKAVETGRPAS